MGRYLVYVVVFISLVGCYMSTSTDFSNVFDGSGGNWIDLSYAYSEETIYWPTADGFQIDEVSYGETEAGYFYSAYNISTAEHGGTHIDAPIHFFRGGMTVEEIPLDRLIAPAVVVDVSDHTTPDYLISVSDLKAWESRHMRIPDGSIVIFHTGWGDRWPDRLSYLGTELKGLGAVSELHFPGIQPEAARWLVANRAISAVGIDTPSIDYGQSKSFESHLIFYSSNIPGFENVANLNLIPEFGAFVVALPMKIAGGSGGPLRIVAFVPSSSPAIC